MSIFLSCSPRMRENWTVADLYKKIQTSPRALLSPRFLRLKLIQFCSWSTSFQGTKSIAALGSTTLIRSPPGLLNFIVTHLESDTGLFACDRPIKCSSTDPQTHLSSLAARDAIRLDLNDTSRSLKVPFNYPPACRPVVGRGPRGKRGGDCPEKIRLNLIWTIPAKELMHSAYFFSVHCEEFFPPAPGS